ncbi:DNA-binding domain-containing protein [Paraburkholderia sp. BL10I2N1]|uniref:HvfC/BufC N-terminal domain-containing protein n=1 Tax=Paraburkholderia sp. BL10I2N1 TaxID=1938796 RepID=UPI0010614825|nr:DNA-binding domain-containing protein [Paraburkholderia sp. BL10I2N1]TDN64027.1 putative DNA-binding protein [Paraburkholderia sp. BL10I2N1]
MNTRTPSLTELQQAMRQSLLHHEHDDVAAVVLADGLDPQARLNIYRNTAAGVLVNALRLAFPCLQRLVGTDFFEGAARLFCTAAPPRSAWLDEFGAAFPEFLAQMPQIASVPYVADVARLEWQVNCVLHAPDVAPLDLACLAQLDEDALGALRLRPHPAARLLRCEYPADVVWRAVLEQDDRALGAIQLADGPVHLLVQRVTEGVDTLRLSVGEWRISAALFAGEAVGDALACAPEADGYALVGAYLARRCFAQGLPPASHSLVDEGSPS